MIYRDYQVIEFVGTNKEYVMSFDADDDGGTRNEVFEYARQRVITRMDSSKYENPMVLAIGAIIINDIEYLGGYALVTKKGIVFRSMVEAFR